MREKRPEVAEGSTGFVQSPRDETGRDGTGRDLSKDLNFEIVLVF